VLRFVVWVLLLAAVVYALFWIMDRRTRGGPRRGGFGGGSRPVRPPSPKGPDDDENFLRDLDWQRRRDARRKPPGDQATGPDPDPASDEHDQSGADDSTEPPHK
jgi:hypothetical protein